MSLEATDQVDAVGIDRTSGAAVLTIADSWDWSNPRQHLLALQDKLNAYFRFIESGQLLEAYPQAKGRKLVIDIISKHSLPSEAQTLLARASGVAEELSVSITTRTFPGA